MEAVPEISSRGRGGPRAETTKLKPCCNDHCTGELYSYVVFAILDDYTGRYPGAGFSFDEKVSLPHCLFP